MEETKIIYYLDTEEVPYSIVCSCPPDKITLRDFKNELDRPVSKVFSRSFDKDIGVVKQEIKDDNAKLPYENGKVLLWLTLLEFYNKHHTKNNGSSPKKSLPKESKISSSSKKQKESNAVKIKTDICTEWLSELSHSTDEDDSNHGEVSSIKSSNIVDSAPGTTQSKNIKQNTTSDSDDKESQSVENVGKGLSELSSRSKKQKESKEVKKEKEKLKRILKESSDSTNEDGSNHGEGKATQRKYIKKNTTSDSDDKEYQSVENVGKGLSELSSHSKKQKESKGVTKEKFKKTLKELSDSTDEDDSNHGEVSSIKSSNIVDSAPGKPQATTMCPLPGGSKTINILLLGETGVGKSTWINGFVNYLTYESLEEAKKSEPVSLIPSQFTVRDSDFNEHTISYGVGSDPNEAKQLTGQSSTQMPKSYLFNLQNIKIRIIDTPGIGDTRGIEKDKENMQNIMTHLANYKELNGIVVLLKPNNARLTSLFSFCIKELLTHLHKDACKNIIICFTNARGTFYRPGDTFPALQELLAKSKTIDIKLTRNTVYCMDNEAVRFLMALKKINFDKNEQQDYASSWKKSVEESMRLIIYICSLRPHLTQKTISINSVRRSIIEHCRPMAEIVKCIQTNIDAIKDKQDEFTNTNKSKDELLKDLKIPVVTAKVIELPFPQTVCTAQKCISVIKDGNDGEYIKHYKTVCHSPCSITTDKNTVQCVELQGCWAMGESIEKCRVCSCPWNTHMHITYDMKEETILKEDENIKKLINEKDGKMKAIKEHQKQLNDRLKKLIDGKERLAKVNAQFACFLKHNAIAPFNDALLEHLKILIENEKMKGGLGINDNTLKGLMSTKQVYEKEIKTIENAIKENTGDGQYLDVERIDKLMSELRELPIVGDMIKEAMKNVRKANDKATDLNDIIINVEAKKKKGFQGIFNAWIK